MVTKNIMGYKFTLVSGKTYRASRPMSDRTRSNFPVSIEDVETGQIVVEEDNLTYYQANALISAFNDGPTSFDGRIW